MLLQDEQIDVRQAACSAVLQASVHSCKYSIITARGHKHFPIWAGQRTDGARDRVTHLPVCYNYFKLPRSRFPHMQR